MKYIALLRGINVSGKNIIKMETLRAEMASLAGTNVSTYIQSGNILFESKASAGNLEQKIAELIQDKFGLEITVIVVTPDDLKDAIRLNPYYEKTPEDSVQPYIGFLSEEVNNEFLETLKAVDFQNDTFEIIGRTIYIWYHDSAANTKLSNAVIERKLKLRVTMRNLKTIKKLIALSA